MNIKLYLVDGSTMTYDENGILVGCTDTEGNVEDHTGYSNGPGGAPDIHGIWYKSEECDIPWDEVVKYEYTDFHLTSDMYLDNGRVMDEGRIVAIEIDGVMKWDMRSTGGCDTSGWDSTDDNVYCELCEVHYTVNNLPEGRKPSHCVLCGHTDIILRVDVLH